jgi:predicted transposase YdaD
MLVAADPPAWLALAGLPATGPVSPIDAGLDTVRAQADAVLRVGRQQPWFLHVELQTGRDRKLPERVHRYNVLLYERERRPIVSLVVLLRPRADGRELTGQIDRHDPTGRPYEWFRYQVVRAWTLPTEALLNGPLGTLPLAPLPELYAPGRREAERRSRVRRVIEEVGRRLRDEVPPGQADELRVATHYLLGLRYPEAITAQLTRGIWAMQDSKTYQYAIETGREQGRDEGRVEGRVDEVRRLLTRFGERRLGPAPATVQAMLETIEDVERLEGLFDRVDGVQSWDELLES